MLTQIASLERGLGRLEYYVAALSLIVIVFATAIAVVSRNVFASPVIWTSELALLAQVWLTFIGAAYVFKQAGHVGISGVVERLSPGIARLLFAARDIILAALLIYVGITVMNLMSRQWAQSLSTLGLPRALTSLPVVWAMFSISASALISVMIDRQTIASATDEGREPS